MGGRDLIIGRIPGEQPPIDFPTLPCRREGSIGSPQREAYEGNLPLTLSRLERPPKSLKRPDVDVGSLAPQYDVLNAEPNDLSEASPGVCLEPNDVAYIVIQGPAGLRDGLQFRGCERRPCFRVLSLAGDFQSLEWVAYRCLQVELKSDHD